MNFLVYLRNKRQELNPFQEAHVVDIETPKRLCEVEDKFKKIEDTIKKAMVKENCKIAS